jgi:WD40 repeat protein
VDAVGSLAFSPTGDRLLSAGSDGLVRLWSVADGSVERDFAPVVAGSYSVKYGSGASFSPDGRWAASGGFAAAYGGSTVIGIWSVADGTLARQLIAPADGYGGGAAWSPDGQVMLGGGGGGLYVWNVQDLAAARP